MPFIEFRSGFKNSHRWDYGSLKCCRIPKEGYDLVPRQECCAHQESWLQQNFSWRQCFHGLAAFFPLKQESSRFWKGVVVPKNKKRDLRPKVFKVFEGLLWHYSDKSGSNILLLLDSSRKWFILYKETLLDSELFATVEMPFAALLFQEWLPDLLEGWHRPVARWVSPQRSA